ncbi:MAG: hypothetical protein R2874_09675 [Desulfobacterales bacterium]
MPYAEIRHPSDTQDEDHTAPGPLAGALSIVAEAMDLSGAETIASVPPKFISYRNFQVPFKDRKKIRQVLPFELEPVLPFAVDDLIIDFQIIHPAEKQISSSAWPRGMKSTVFLRAQAVRPRTIHADPWRTFHGGVSG